MDLYNYTAFSLACEEGHSAIAELLIEKGANTSVPNHHGLTGLDMVRGQAKHAAMRKTLEKYTEQRGHSLYDEERRNLSRPPVKDERRERAEIDFGRLGYWDQDSEEGQHKHFTVLAEGAYGKVTRVPLGIPYRTASGRLYRYAVAKSTKLSGDDISVRVADGSNAADSEIKALSNEIQTLHKVRHINIVMTFGFTYGAPTKSAQPGHMLLLEVCWCDLRNLIYLTGPTTDEDKLTPDEMISIAPQMA